MRHLIIAASALSLLAGGAAFAQSGQGGSIGKTPGAYNGAGQPVGTPAQGTGGPGNTTPPYTPGSASSGSAGMSSGTGAGISSGPTDQGTSTYGTPGKVGGRDNR